MPTGTRADVLTLEPGSLVTLYDLDLTLVYGPVLSINPHTVGNIYFNGATYQPGACDATGFERSTGGVNARPKFRVHNYGSAITAALKAYGAIEGCVFTRTRIFAKYLDATNGAIATSPDPSQAIRDIWKIEQKTGEMEEGVEFSLSISGDAEGFKIPARTVKASGCSWSFRGFDCGFTGSAPGIIFYDKLLTPRTVVQDMGAWNSGSSYSIGDAVYSLVNSTRVYYISLTNGNTGNIPALSLANWAKHVCLKRPSDCKLNWGLNNPLPGDFFPGTSFLPSV